MPNLVGKDLGQISCDCDAGENPFLLSDSVNLSRCLGVG